MNADLSTSEINRKVIASKTFKSDKIIKKKLNESSIKYKDSVDDNKMSDNTDGSNNCDDVSEENHMRLKIARLESSMKFNR